jgi:hypothetical protein
MEQVSCALKFVKALRDIDERFRSRFMKRRRNRSCWRSSMSKRLRRIQAMSPRFQRMATIDNGRVIAGRSASKPRCRGAMSKNYHFPLVIF